MAGELLCRSLSTMASKIPKSPLIVIVGATGTGKSKLAVSLASKYNGEIINGDAIQMYKGLPIVTNKIPENERNGIPHHLLDCIGLDEEPWTVHQFVKESSKIIEQIRARGKLPILVGGTHYYVHGLLFTDSTLTEKSAITAEQNKSQISKFDILNESTEKIFAKLQQVDPVMANRWHPNDRRKIRRSLEIWLQTGQKASDIYDEQQQRKKQSFPTAEGGSGDADDGSLRFDTLIYWLDAEDGILKERLNARVETMVESGLLDEIEEMHAFESQSKRGNRPVDRSIGIWVAIGYKEMEPWLIAKTTSIKNEKELNTLRSSCIEAVQAGTRRYAKRQNRYIRIRLANALHQAHAERYLFLLDSSELDRWHDSVETDAQHLLNAFLTGETLPEASSLSKLAVQTFAQMSQTPDHANNRISRFCHACQKTLMTETEWLNHLKSRSHRKTIASQKKPTSINQAETEPAVQRKARNS